MINTNERRNVIDEIAKIKRQTIERVELEFENCYREGVVQWLYENGYSVKRSGPKPKGGGKVSTTHQLFIAERGFAELPTS